MYLYHLILEYTFKIFLLNEWMCIIEWMNEHYSTIISTWYNKYFNILQVISELENNLIKVSQLIGDGISNKSRPAAGL